MLPSGVEVRPAQPEDVDLLVSEMREIDRREVEALIGPGDPTTAIRQTLERSDMASSVWLDGELLGLGGLSTVSLLDDSWSPWFLATRLADRHPRVIIQLGKRYIPEIMAQYPKMTNHVSVKNTRAVRWLLASGFVIDPPEGFGLYREPFYRFHTGD